MSNAQFRRSALAVCLLPLSAVAAAGCSCNAPVRGPSSSDAAQVCTTACGCCASDEVCFEDQCCKPSCEGKACGTDRCGGHCAGSCPSGYLCNDARGTCECAAESDEAFCVRMNKDCGTAQGLDLCGTNRSVACDRCAPPAVCNRTLELCECTGEPGAELCVREDAHCGTLTTPDRCGEMRTVDCGSCGAQQICDPVTRTCINCVPETDAEFCGRLHKDCGTVDAHDNCDLARTADCGSCAPGYLCNEATNVCESCTPESDTQFCAEHGGANCGAVTGQDHCRLTRTVASCGPCPAPKVCDAANHCQACPAETDVAFCARNGKQCGPFSDRDNCGDPRAVTSCGSCPSNEVCVNGACLTCQPESDADLCAFYYKDCGTPTLVDRCGATRTPNCGSCSGTQTCSATNVCTSNPSGPANDTCASPERLLFDATGTATSSGDLSTATADYTGSCGGAGKDLVYVFTLTAANLVTVSVTAGGTSIWPEAYLRTTCTSTTDLACAYASSSGANLTLNAHVLAAGTYYLIVDGYAGANGAFTLTVTATAPPAPPSNDTCATPTVLSFVGNVATATGDTANAVNDYADSCGSSTLSGPDVVFEFSLAADSALVAKVTRDAAATRYYPAIEILPATACPIAAGTPALGCATQSSGVATVAKGVLPAGDYYVVVDGTVASSGAFTLEVTTSAPLTNDVCSGALPVTLSPVAGGTAGDLAGSIAGDTTGATDDYTSSCNAYGTGRDLVYSFEVPAGTTKSATVVVVPASGSALDPAVSIRVDCTTGAAERGCAYTSSAATSVVVIASNLAAGTYYVFVDGYYTSSNGPFTLNVTLTDPPPNDLCAGALAVALNPVAGSTDLTGSTSGDTSSAGDDYTSSCNTGTTGRDLVYSFTVPTGSTKDAKLEVAPAAGSALKPAVSVRVDCTAGAAEKGCGRQVSVAPVSVTTKPLVAGTYYVFVDGYSANSNGPFTLTVTLSDPPPNDLCAGALPVTLTAVSGSTDLSGSLSGDTSAASDDYTSSCNTSLTGKDLVYSFTVPSGATKDARVEVVPSSGSALEPVVSVRTDCTASAVEKGCAKSTTVVPVALIVRQLVAGTYQVFVDGWATASNGPFTLTVTLSDPPPAAINDVCSRASALTLDPTTNTATVVATTIAAADDYTGSCATTSSPHSGGDVAYSFTLGQAASVVVSAVRDPADTSFRPAVYLQSTCGSNATDLACGNESSGTAKVTKTNLAAGTYYVIVDGIAGSAGGFTLTVATLDPITNDSCSTPKVLSFNAAGKAYAHADSCAAGDHVQSGTTGNCTGAGYGPDLVYEIDLTSAKDIDVSYSPGHSNESMVYLRTACATASTELLCNDATGALNTMKVKGVAPGTYYLVVDNYAGYCGVFSLEVTLTTPAPPPANDSCAAPETLYVDAATGIATATGSTENAISDYDGSCRAGSSRDVVYSLTLGQTQSVLVRATPQTGSLLKPVVYLRSTCLDAATEQSCKAVSTANTAAEFQNPRLAAGTYAIFVDSYAANATGAFDLQVQVTAPSAVAANDLCANAAAMPAFDPVTNKASVAGNTFDGSNDDASYCATATTRLNGPDLVYAFTLAAPAQVTAKVTRTAPNTTYRPAVSIRSSCRANDEDACAVDTSGVSTASASFAAGTYYVFVDGIDNTFGPFTLELTKGTALDGDTCGIARALNFNGGTTATETGTLATGATNGGDGSCMSVTGADLVYSMSFATEKIATIALGSPSGSTALEPEVYVRRTCNDKASEVGCAYSYTGGATATVSTSRLAAGSYFVFVDAYSSSSQGPFVLTVTLADPVNAVPSNDTCRAATALTLDPVTNLARVSGDTRDGYDDYAGTCATASAPHNGADLVYSVTTPAQGRLLVAVTRDSSTPGYLPAVYLRATCASAAAADEKACAMQASTSSTYTTSSVAPTTLPAGTYYVVVDGQKATAGKFTLDVAFRSSASAIANGSCATAEGLTFDANGLAVALGDTTLGASTSTGSCTSSGPELVYTFSLGQTKDVSIDVLPSAGFEPSVYLRSTCSDPATQKDCQYSYATQPLNLTSWKLAAGVYSIFVDSYSSSYGGPFAMRVKASDPPPAPAYDTCAGAQLLTLPASGAPASRVSDSTIPATNDYTGGCATATYPFDGPEVVYAFALSSNAQVTAKVTPKPNSRNYLPAVYIRATCATVDNDVCKFSSSAGPSYPATVTASLAAGLYYLIVDGVSGTAGEFDLDLSQDTTKYVDGDHCINALSLDASFVTGANGESTASFSGDTLLATNDGDGSCVGATGGDFVYSFTVRSASIVDLSVGPNGTGSSYTSGLYLRRGTCTDTSTQVSCLYTSARQTPKSTRLLGVAPGTYYLWIDSYGTSTSYNGPFAGSVTLAPMPPPPSNDSCSGASALALPASGSPATVLSASTIGAANDYVGACGSSSSPLDGPDVVYSFTLATAAQVTAKVTPKANASTYKAAVYLRPTCATVDRDVCKYSSSAGSSYPAQVTASLPAGTYYLVVDGVSGTQGDFDLAVSRDDTRYVDGDHCINAKSVDGAFVAGTLPGEVVATITDDTLRATNDGDGSCVGATGGDFVYSFTVLRDSLVKVDVSRASGSSYTPQFYLRSSCTDSSTQLYCTYTSGSTAQSGTLYHVAPGTYYLWIDSYGTSASYNGPFSATLSVRDMPLPPSNDSCLGATLLSFVPSSGTRSTATLTGEDSTFATNDTAGNCYSSAGNDLVYQFTVSGASSQSFSATVTAGATSTAFKPVIYLRTVCDQSSDLMEVTCNKTTSGGASNPVTITANSLPPGTYYLLVDSYRSSTTDPPGGTFNLTAWLDAPIAGPANDSCPFAQSIALAGPAPSVTTLTNQTTVGAVNDTSSSCGATSGPGNDVVYSFVLPSDSKVSVKVTPASGFYPAVYLRRGCGSGDGGNQLACASSSSSSATPVEATRAYARAGTFYVWVDAGTSTAANAAGGFSLDVTLATPTVTPPANDVCAGAIALSFGAAPLAGTAVDAFNDYPSPGTSWTPVCQSYTWKPKGPDVVYTYTPTTSGSFTVSLDASWDSLLWYNTGTCGDASTCGAIRDAGNPEFITVTNGVAATTYYFYVSTYSTSVTVGAFTIKVY